MALKKACINLYMYGGFCTEIGGILQKQWGTVLKERYCSDMGQKEGGGTSSDSSCTEVGYYTYRYRDGHLSDQGGSLKIEGTLSL